MPIYFVQAGEGGPVKIGFARDIKLRMNKMRSDNHEPLHLVASFVGEVADERALHEMFAAHHKQREWFYPSVLTKIELVTLAPLAVVTGRAKSRGPYTRSPEHCQAIREGVLRRLADPEYRARRKAAQQPGGSEWLKCREAHERHKREWQQWQQRCMQATGGAP